MDQPLARLPDRAEAGRRRVLRDHGLPTPWSDAGLGEHRRPRPDPGVARSPRPTPGPQLPRSSGPGGPGHPTARPGSPRLSPQRSRGLRAGDGGRPRCQHLQRSSGEHVDAGVRLVHARVVRRALRVPVPQEPAAALRLLPLQQARLADTRGHRVSPCARSGRLPRLDHGRHLVVRGRTRVLLRLHDDNGQHGLSRPRRRISCRCPDRVRGLPRRCTIRSCHLQAQL